MLPEIKLTISANSKVLETITRVTSTTPTHLVTSIAEFQRLTNAALTKMIEEMGESADCVGVENEEDSDDDSEDIEPISPKKRKK